MLMKQDFVAVPTSVFEILAAKKITPQAAFYYILLLAENAAGIAPLDALGIDAFEAVRLAGELSAAHLIHGNTLRRIKRIADGEKTLQEKAAYAKKELEASGPIETFIVEKENERLMEWGKKTGRVYRRSRRVAKDVATVRALRAQIARLGERDAMVFVRRFYENGGYGVDNLVNAMKKVVSGDGVVVYDG